MEHGIPNLLVHVIPDPLEVSPEHHHHTGGLSFRSKKKPPLSLSPRFQPPREPLPRTPAKVDPWTAAAPEDPETVDSNPNRAAVLSLGIRTADDPSLPTGGGFAGDLGVARADAATPAAGLAH